MTNHTKAGFSAIELLTVIAVAGILAGMTVPGILGSLRRGRINEGAQHVSTAISQARMLARQGVPAPDRWGVVIVGDEDPAWVGVTHGPEPVKSAVVPGLKWAFNAGVRPWVGEAPLDGTLGWIHQWQNGNPALPAAPTTDAAIGVSPTLSLRSIDGRMRVALAVYEVGIVAVREF